MMMAMSGWYKLWRSAVRQDMELTPHEFKLWYLLQTVAFRTDTERMKRGTLERSYSDLRIALSRVQLWEDSIPLFSYSTLSKALARLVETGRIVRLEPDARRRNRLKFRIREWDLMQHGNYDAVPGRDRAGWLKVWRSALYCVDMADLSPAEFKLWILLQSLASHTETDKYPRGSVRTSYTHLAATLRDLKYKPDNLSRMLMTLEDTKRIDLTGDKHGELRIRIQDWDEMQHGHYDAE